MKKYIKQLLNIGLILLIISVWSCDSNINLNAEGIISADGYFSTPEDYEKSLNSLYGILDISIYNVQTILLIILIY